MPIIIQHYLLNKIEVQKESLVYDYQDLLADFGGYLGLLLGVSMLSIYDYALELFIKIFQILKRQEAPIVSSQS